LQARVPENVFREHVKVTCDSGRELTSSRLLRLAKQWKASVHANGQSNDEIGNGNRNAKSSGSRVRIINARTDSNPIDEIVSELINHHDLLDNVLRPIYSGDTVTLTPADRRVLRYLLLEVRQLLGRLEKVQKKAADCTCQNSRAHC
jgi:hypothetical protein